MRFFNFIIFISLLLTSSFNLNAQQTKKSERGNVTFKIHKVEKGQSLYAIAKLYQVELNEIVMENPEAIDGIKVGQELKIPITKVKKENEKTENNDSYDPEKTHKVLKGETVYSICKKYNLSQPQLVSLNPSLKESGLKEGQLLLVKQTSSTKNESLTNSKTKPEEIKHELPVNNLRYEIYQAKQEDDLNSILRFSEMNETEFYALNPEARQGIKKNQLLKIIRKKIDLTSKTEITQSQTEQDVTEKKLQIDTSRLIKKNNYTIGLLLPFKFNETDAIDLNKIEDEKQNFPEQQSIAIDFYEGINYALHKIDSTNSVFKLEIFDVSEKDSLKTETIIKESRFQNLDLCIGPVYNTMFKQVAEKCKLKNIPIVAPFTQQNKILFENQHASKTTPSSITLVESMAELIIDSMEKANVIIINSRKPKEQNLIKAFKSKYNSYLTKKNRPISDTATEVKSNEIENITGDQYDINYFIIISEDELYLTDLLTRLSRTKFTKSKNNVIIGLKKWIEMENIDADYLNRFNFIYPASNYIDLNHSEVINATEFYREIYITDPGDYFYLGIDIGVFYTSCLKKYGKNFYEFLNTEKKPGMIMDFNFFRPSLKTGFENKSVRLIQYKDFQFSKIH